MISIHNVPGLLSSEDGRFFGRVLRDLAEEGCHVWWYCFPAYAAGASFWGERVAIVAASACVRWDGMEMHKRKKSENLNHKDLGPPWPRQDHLRFSVARTERDASGGVHRNDDGFPSALDRLESHGNAVAPQQFYPIFRAIAEVEEMHG